MRRIICLIIFKLAIVSTIMASDITTLYDKSEIKEHISIKQFTKAAEGFYLIKERNSNILTFIDFSVASTQKRLYIIDMSSGKLLFNTYVSHGKNSGDLYAKYFSNREGSLMSSRGFYLTADTYYGGNGYSLRLKGLEKGVNDNAYKRYIVVHGASYANPSTIAQRGKLGRSFGCPAVPQNESRTIIDLIKGGSVLYIHTEAN